MSKHIYLDNAATTPLDGDVFEKIKPYFKQHYGNPSSSHRLGEEAQKAINKAQEQVAKFLGCLAEEIIFTSGATESNNLAIQGLVKNFRQQNPGQKPHIITSLIEHPSVLNTCQALKKDGLAEVTFLKISDKGTVDPKNVKKTIKKNTVLVSVMYANNEIGTIQPLREIGKIVKAAKQPSGYPFFHTDAVQAVNYCDCSVNKLGLDLLTFNAHKIYGPKGIGVLYVRSKTPISRLVYGGGQQSDLRSGTENVAAIVGLAEAVVKLKSQKAKNKQIGKLRDKLVEKVLKNIDDTKLNGSLKNRLVNNANISFRRAEGESIVFSLAEKGIFVSTGSACASKSLKPSHVLTALGLTPIASHSSVRFSLGRYTSKKDIDYVLRVLPAIIKRLREISGQ